MEKQKDTTELEVTYGEITEKNLGLLKVLNRSIFPVQYNDKFYTDLLASPDLCRLVYHHDVLVGAVCCRFELPKPPNAAPNAPPTVVHSYQLKSVDKKSADAYQNVKLYIMTLGVLANYRGHKIGGKLLEFVLQICKETPAVDEVYLHVQTSNEDAVAFYKKFDFEVAGTIENYYKRIEPPHCYILQKKLKPK